MQVGDKIGRCRLWWLPLLAGLLQLTGCSSSAPAPVAALDTAPVRSLPKGSLSGSHYVVQRGDTLYSIAFASGRDFRALARSNGLDRDYTIYPGQRLSLNTSRYRPPAPAKAVSSKPVAKPAPKPVVKPAAPVAVAKTLAKPAVVAKPQPKPAAPVKREAPLPSKVAKWIWPVSGKVIQGFSNAEQGNKGVDIAAASGTPVVSAADGRVVYAGSALRGYGQLLIIKHSDDYLSAYAHNRKLLVKEQQQVKVGQKIAEVGNTDADRNMLHFEIRYQGKSVDPIRYLPRR
ncbi:peptidoglycan DD-metalloendopeptidase family protein [Ferrimonas senticii]|uniref:peptidoglycan DD-metalloendopeptidase family protein n=1 Tax=Ferrimonas senticii TaxID=394566 RepID=UPI001F0A1725|nr:peptidoglycan DD-metalloendopeptidase family protein [Ferrimonas senticii]